MQEEPTAVQNPADTFVRPNYSYRQAGKYNGVNVLFSGNQEAPGKGADWNWLSLYTSPLSSAIQSGSLPSTASFANLTVSNLILPSMLPGSVLFAGASGVVSQNNAHFFWDITNTRQGIGTITPRKKLDVLDASGSGQLRLTYTDNSVYTEFKTDSTGLMFLTPTTGATVKGVVLGGTDLGATRLSVFSATSGQALVVQSATVNGTKIVACTNSASIVGTVYAYHGSIATTNGHAYITIQQNDNGVAALQALVLGTGDAVVECWINGGTAWTFGLDNSDSDKFKISNGSSLGAATTTDDLIIDTNGLWSNGTNSVGFGNGTTAQTVSVYNTYTAGTPDYERLELFWSANTANIRTAKSGTGTARSLVLQYGGTSANAVAVATAIANGIILSNGATSGAGYAVNIAASFTSLSGTPQSLLLNPTLSDGGSTSTTTPQVLSISPTINYTAASKTGKVVLAYFNPTLTSLPSGNNAGVAFSSAFTSSSFPAVRFFNTADEDTNAEWFEQGWHVSANTYVLRTNKLGTGTTRTFGINYGGSANTAISVSANGTAPLIQLAATSFTAAGTRVTIPNGNGNNSTSGTSITLQLNENFNPIATSTMSARCLVVSPTINFSAGTPGAGYLYGVYIAPTNTALPTGISGGVVHSSTSSGLTAAEIFNNQTDEQTNYEQVRLGYSANIFTISSVKGGTGTVRDIKIDTGTADIQWGKALVALGAGAAATLGLIGGTGPATAAQNSWKQEKDSTGATYWTPVWK